MPTVILFKPSSSDHSSVGLTDAQVGKRGEAPFHIYTLHPLAL